MITTFWKNLLATIGAGTVIAFLTGATAFTYDLVARLSALEAVERHNSELLGQILGHLLNR